MVRTAIIALIAALFAAGCAKPRRIVVGSKNFTEQDILGEILAQQIERRMHVQVDRKPHIGGTLLAHQALVSGAIDLYPEYTGTALTAVLKRPAKGDAREVFRAVADEYLKKWSLVWMPPFGFSNTFAMTVRGDTARTKRVSALSEAARSGSWKLGAGYEFLQRPDGLNGLVRTYGLRLQDAPVSMDLGLLYQALQSGRVDLIASSSTDGMLSVLDVKVLADDRKYFPPYECSVVVRGETGSSFPALRATLNELSGAITEEEMRRMNHAADGQHRPVREIAREFLARVGN